MGFLGELFDTIFSRDEAASDYAYNYTYLPPVAMIDNPPARIIPLEWMAQVIELQLRVIINMMAVVEDKSQHLLIQDLDQLVDEFRSGNPLRFIKALVEFLDEMVKDAEEDVVQIAHSFAKLSYQLTLPDNDVVIDLLTLFQDMQNAMLKDLFEKRVARLQDYRDFYRHIPLPEIADNFADDATFAFLRVAGPNPTMLRNLSGPLEKFPVTNTHFQAVMGPDDDLASAMSTGRVFIADYQILENALPGSFPGPEKYIGAPIAMFAVAKTGPDLHLRPIAIQCGQEPGPQYPIIVPPTETSDQDAAIRWQMAKSWLQTADGNYHEAVAHLGHTHLVVSPFSVATPNQLGKGHPVGKLLMPHFEGTFTINDSAQASLIASKGIIDQIMSSTIDVSRAVACAGARSLSLAFDQNYFKQQMAARGVDNPATLPYYPYRDCGQKIWDALNAWIGDYLALCYPEEEDPLKDEALQAWHREVIAHDGGRIGSFGEDGALRTRTYLRDALTMVIFTASAGHAAVNFPQWSIEGYPPAMPLAAFAPPPRADRTYTQADYLNMLPPVGHTIVQLNTGYLLGNVYYTVLGDYGDDYFENNRVKAALANFQKRLTELETEFARDYPEYPHLLPSKIPQSINI